MITQLFPVYAQPAVNFTEALAAAVNGALQPPFSASAMNNLLGVPNWGNGWFFIQGIRYTAVQNIGLEFDFFGSALGDTTDPATNTFIGRYQFAAANGVQINGTGLYQYQSGPLVIPYFDRDATPNPATIASTIQAATLPAIPPRALHVKIQNIDVNAKSANAAGAISATFWLQAMESVQG